jgi:hypothetical protein
MAAFCHLETFTCDNDSPNPENKLPIETRLVKCLRVWCEKHDAIISGNRTVHQEISALLEWYICECIAYSPDKRMGGWWSDGVIILQIEQTGDNAFNLLGVTYIGCQGIAPFDIDVVLASDSDNYFAKCLFRIGALDPEGRPMICDSRRAAARILEMRPRETRDWAMAVELTPPTET